MNNSTEIFSLLYTYGYHVLFPLVLLEGPIATIAGGFLVAGGYMNFYMAYLVVIVADLAGDIIYYWIGRSFLNTVGLKLLSFVGIDSKNIEHAKKAMNYHKGKILFFGKLSHAIGGPILIAAGALKVPIKDFVLFNFLATIPKSLTFLMVGYLFGDTIGRWGKYIKLTSIGLALFTVIVVVIYLQLYKKAKRLFDNL